jgi:hypothetical protein
MLLSRIDWCFYFKIAPLCFLPLMGIACTGASYSNTSLTINPPTKNYPTKASSNTVQTTPRQEEEEPNRNAVTKTPPRTEENPFGGPGQTFEEKDKVPAEKDPPIPESFKPFPKDVAKNPKYDPKKDYNRLFLETVEGGKRRVHLLAEVCLREGQLEALLCKAVSKEHESILRVDVDGRLIHTALLATGANPGSPAKFWNPKTEQPEYTPASGDKIKITLTYYKDGKLRTETAQRWIKDSRTEKEMTSDWVFAGSRLIYPPDDPEERDNKKADEPKQKIEPFYGANNGDFISIANFPDSMLDLPVKSSKDNAERTYEAVKDRIPGLGTKVLVTLEFAGKNKEK